MLELNLPQYTFRIVNKNGKLSIFDDVRKAFVNLTPEEWVRQNFIRFLVTEKHIPLSHIASETSLVVNERNKRTDAVVYGKEMKPLILIEFKAPDVAVNTKVFEQINRYNLTLRLKYLVVTNGLQHYYARDTESNGIFEFINDLPDYEQL